MSRATRANARKDLERNALKESTKPPSPPQQPPEFPSLPGLFSQCETREHNEQLAALKTKVQPRPDDSSVPTLPNDVLLDRQKVESLTEDRLKEQGFTHEICEFPDHVRQIERLKVEKEFLKGQISYEKAKNAIIHGEFSTFRELARRVLDGDKSEKSWDSRQEAFVRQVGGLLGLKSKDELEDENYPGHDIAQEPLELLYWRKRLKE